MALSFEEPFGFDSGHAACAGCSNGLAIDAILNVTRVEHAGDIGARPHA